MTKKLQTHFLARGKRQTKSISRRILPKKCSKWLKNSKAGRVQFPTNSVATFEVLTPIVKVWCLFKVVSGGPGANLETLTAQKFRCQVLMCISTAQTRSKWLALLLPLHFARFSCYVHFLWETWDTRGIRRSRTSFCVTGAGHRTQFHLRGRRGTFCTLLKRWQAGVEMKGVFGAIFRCRRTVW